MKKIVFIALFFLTLSMTAQRGKLRIAYIDMEMILDSMPEYRQSMDELNLRVVQWKSKMDEMKREIDRLKKELEAEKMMLTEDLYKEKLEIIRFKEKQLSKFQMEKFGPQGDLVLQRMMILKPIQDKVFNIVQKLAETRHYDVVFDKSSKEAGVVFINNKLNITHLVIRELKKQQRSLRRKKTKAKKEKKNKNAIDLREKYQERRKRMQEERKRKEEAKKAAAEKAKKEKEAAESEKKKETGENNKSKS